MSSLICVVQHWRCNSVTYWPALVEDLEDVITFMLALGYHRDSDLMKELITMKAQGITTVIKELPPGWSKAKNQTAPGDPATLGTPVAPKEKQDFNSQCRHTSNK